MRRRSSPTNTTTRPAVSFLKDVARAPEFRAGGEGNHLAAFIALALLAEKNDSVPFLKSSIEDEKMAEHAPTVAIMFLPPKRMRGLAEALVQDEMQSWYTRTQAMMLLRAVGDGESIKKLEVLKPGEVAPDAWRVHGRTMKFLKSRLALDAAAQARWSEQLLLIQRIMGMTPRFRGVNIAIAWITEKIDREEKNLAPALLGAMLDVELPPRIGDRAVDLGHDVAVAATLAKMQKKTELLPALEKLAAVDWGFVTSHCKTAATALRKEKGK